MKENTLTQTFSLLKDLKKSWNYTFLLLLLALSLPLKAEEEKKVYDNFKDAKKGTEAGISKLYLQCAKRFGRDVFTESYNQADLRQLYERFANDLTCESGYAFNDQTTRGALKEKLNTLESESGDKFLNYLDAQVKNSIQFYRIFFAMLEEIPGSVVDGQYTKHINTQKINDIIAHLQSSSEGKFSQEELYRRSNPETFLNGFLRERGISKSNASPIKREIWEWMRSTYQKLKKESGFSQCRSQFKALVRTSNNCAVLKYLISYSPDAGGSDRSFKVGKGTEQEKTFSCKSFGPGTVDYKACKQIIAIKTTGDVAIAGVQIGAQAHSAVKSLQLAKNAQDFTLEAGYQASLDSARSKQAVAKTYARTYEAKMAALGLVLANFPTPKKVARICRQSNFDYHPQAPLHMVSYEDICNLMVSRMYIRTQTFPNQDFRAIGREQLLSDGTNAALAETTHAIMKKRIKNFESDMDQAREMLQDTADSGLTFTPPVNCQDPANAELPECQNSSYYQGFTHGMDFNFPDQGNTPHDLSTGSHVADLSKNNDVISGLERFSNTPDAFESTATPARYASNQGGGSGSGGVSMGGASAPRGSQAMNNPTGEGGDENIMDIEKGSERYAQGNQGKGFRYSKSRGNGPGADGNDNPYAKLFDQDKDNENKVLDLPTNQQKRFLASINQGMSLFERITKRMHSVQKSKRLLHIVPEIL